MADSRENIFYSFQGDVTSLKEATNNAIALLSQFDSAFKKATKQATMDANVTSQKQFTSAVNSTIKELNTLTQVLNKTGNSQIQVLPEQVRAIENATRDTYAVLQMLKTATKLDTTDFKLMSSVIKDARASISAVTQQLYGMGAGFKNAVTLSEPEVKRTTSAVNEFANATRNAVQAEQTQVTKTQEVKNAMQSTYEKFMQSTSVFSGLTSGIDFAKAAMEAFKNSANTTGDSVSKASQQISSAFSRLGDGSDDVADSASKIGAATASASGGMDSAGSAAVTAATSMSKTAMVANAVVHGFKLIGKAATNAINIFKRIGSAISNLTTKLKNTNPLVRELAQLLSGIALGKILGESIKLSIDYVENLNLFAVAMGNAAEAGQTFINTMQELYGLDPSNIMRYAGTFYQLTAAMETPTEAARIMSLGLTKAALDLGSLFNVNFETVAQDLTSGMQGMARSVRKYAMDIRVSTLQQLAFTLGMKENIQTTSEANRQALRYIAMMRQMKNVSGDFARTIESPANQLRVFKEQVSQLGRAFGNFFIPALSAVLPYINGFIMALRVVLELLATLVGFEVPTFGGITDDLDNIGGAIGGVGDSADATKKKIKDLVAPFDELNVLSEQINSAAGGGGGLGDMGKLDPKLLEELRKLDMEFENIRMKANEVRDALLELVGFKWDIEVGLTLIEGGFADQIRKLVLDKKWQGLGSKIADAINTGINTASKVINSSPIADKLGEAIDVITGIINGFAGTFKWKELGQLIADGLNIVVEAIRKFWAGVNWTSVGKGFADGINGFIYDFSWSNLASMATTKLNGLVETMRSFILTLDWKGMALALTTFLKKGIADVKWTEIGKLINDFFSGALDWAFTAVISFDWVAWGEKLGEMILNIKWATLFAKLTLVILTLLGGLLTTVYTQVYTVLGTGMQSIIDTLVISFQLGFESIKLVVINTLDSLGFNVEEWKTSTEARIKELTDMFYAEFGVLPGWQKTNVTDEFAKNTLQFVDDSKQGADKAVSAFQVATSPLPIWFKAMVLTGMLDNISVFAAQLGEKMRGGVAAIQEAFKGLPIWFDEHVVKPIMTFFDNLINSITKAIDKLLNKVTIANGEITKDTSKTSDISKSNSTAGPYNPGKGLATGGVVTGPVKTWVGEGKYDEAVIPLGNSPQMEELLNQFAKIVQGQPNQSSAQEIVVKVYIGEKEFDSFVYQASQRGQQIVGTQPITYVGGK